MDNAQATDKLHPINLMQAIHKNFVSVGPSLQIDEYGRTVVHWGNPKTHESLTTVYFGSDDKPHLAEITGGTNGGTTKKYRLHAAFNSNGIYGVGVLNQATDELTLDSDGKTFALDTTPEAIAATGTALEKLVYGQ